MIIEQNSITDILIDGAREVFETMMSMSVEPYSESNFHISGSSLLGSITFQGKIEGCLGICCGMDCAKEIARNMLEMEPEEDIEEDEVPDALGEVANMVMGAIKTRLLNAIGDIQVSIPTVVSGTELVNSLGERAEKIIEIVKVGNELAEFTLLYRESTEK